MSSVDVVEPKPASAVVDDRPEVSTPRPVAPRATGRASSERLANVERLRLVAMFEIVAFHVSGAVGAEQQRLPIIAGLGLPAFLLLNNAFNTTLSERMGTRAFLDVKVRRLLVPWLVWSVIYAAIVLAERVRHGEPVAEAFPIWVIVGGTYDHLWFVPFALFGGTLIARLQAKTRERSHTRVALSALALGGVLVVIDAVILRSFAIEWPLLQWLFALPSVFLGFALGRVVLAADRRLFLRLGLALTLLGVLCVAGSRAFGVPEMVIRYCVSMALVALAFVWPGRGDALSQKLTPLLFGIYLIHPLLVRVYQAAHLPSMPVAVMALLVFAVAAVLVAVLRRSPLRRLV
jgi:surface polysaccharide O-acyltransferase-like enzyme